MGICCSKKNPNFPTPSSKLDPSIQKNLNPNPQIGKNPEKKKVTKENPITKHRKKNEIDHRLDKETSMSVQKNPSPNPQIVKIPEKITEIKEKPIIKQGKRNEIKQKIEEENSKLIKNNPDPRPQIDKTPEEKTIITEKPIIKHRKRNASDHIFQEEVPISDQKTNSSISNCIENSSLVSTISPNLITNGDEVDSILIQCGRLSCSSTVAQTPISRQKNSVQISQNGGVATPRRASPNRRREPSRERGEKEKEKEKEGSNHPLRERRESRSPGRRLEPPMMMCRDPSGGVSKRVVAKRASPRRSRSPASRVSSENNNQNGKNNQNMRKAEQSPYRRNPLGDMDQNSANNKSLPQKKTPDNAKNSRTKTKQQTQLAEEHSKPHPQTTNHNHIVPTRPRSSRLSRDLDKLDSQNPSSSSYNALLLEDIQNFHNKNPTSLSQCLSKACSIIDQIADLNSIKLLEKKEPPLVETEVVGVDDLMEPSFQKYVTAVERERVGGENWISSSLWETKSSDSADFWASSMGSDMRNTISNAKRR